MTYLIKLLNCSLHCTFNPKLLFLLMILLAPSLLQSLLPWFPDDFPYLTISNHSIIHFSLIVHLPKDYCFPVDLISFFTWLDLLIFLTVIPRWPSLSYHIKQCIKLFISLCIYSKIIVFAVDVICFLTWFQPSMSPKISWRPP